MKKEAIIFAAEMVIGCLFCYFLLRQVGLFLGDPTVIETVFVGVTGGVFMLLDSWRGRIVENDNPVNLKKISIALENVAEKRAGKKCEFVEKFGVEMYNLFWERGYIHELFSADDDNHEWQVTKLGLRRKVELCS